MTIHYLLDAGADPNFKRCDKSTIQAGILRNISMGVFLQLLEGGVDPNAKSHCGDDAFCLALVEGPSVKLLRLLEFTKIHARQGHWLQTPTDLDFSRPAAGTQLVLRYLPQARLIDFKNEKGETMLHGAVSKFKWNLAESLLDHSANVTFEDTYYGTLLHRAIGRILNIY